MSPPMSHDELRAHLLALRPDVTAYLKRKAPRRGDDEDLAQDVMTQGLRRLGNYRPERGRLDQWVGGIAANRVRRAKRSWRRHRHMFLPDLDDANRTPAPGPSPEDFAFKRELRRELSDAVQDMPALYLAVLIAVYIDGRTVENVALELGIPEPTVRSRLNRAIAHLRERLKGREHEFRSILPVGLLAALRSERRKSAVPALPAPPTAVPPGIESLVGAALGGGIVGAGIIAALLLCGPDRLFAERNNLDREHERLTGLARASAMVEEAPRPTMPSCPRPSVSDPPQKANVLLSGQAKQKVADIMSKRSETPDGWR